MALNTVSSDRLSTNVKNTNFTSAEKQDLTNDILPLAGQLGNRNLIINGAMQVAQRGTSSTSVGYQTVDRMTSYSGGLDESPTYSQVDVASGTTPYTNGFRKAFKIQNGNQTSGAGADDHMVFEYRIEDQDLATSGWNYISATSYITMSFWVKSSVAQNFYFNLQSDNGSAYRYVMETGSLSANTWTKVTKTILGNSNIVLNNDTGIGMYINWHLFDGTNRTGTRPLDAWAAADNSNRTPDQTSTWYTTNDATFEITGVQLEVGSVATDFEHRSFGQELELCQRYFYKIVGQDSDMAAFGFNYSASDHYFNIEFPVPMRDYPTYTGSATAARIFAQNIGQDFNLSSLAIVGNMTSSNPKRVTLFVSQGGATAGEGGLLSLQNAEGSLSFSAEL